MIPEPLIIVTDSNGNPHPQFLPGWEPPARTWVQVDQLAYRGWIIVDGLHVKILFGEKTVIYERIGFGLHGEWICDLRSGGANASP